MNTPLSSVTPSSPSSHQGTTIVASILGSLLGFSLLVNAFAGWGILRLQGENRALAAQAETIDAARADALTRAEEAERRLGSASARAQELASVGTYFKSKFQALDAILLETDSNSVDFIDWVVEDATFDHAQDAEDRYATWIEIQDKTNEAYWSLSEEVTSYITALEGGDLPEGSGT